MIPRANIVAWRSRAPWATDADVEQDLVITRALVELFSDPFLSERLAFRGGTALHKLYLDVAYRYSEDIDLVQREPEPIGDTLDAIREVTESWLGEPGYEQSERGTTFYYDFESEIEPVVPLRLKIEINTREHDNFWPYEKRELEVDNPWFSGGADIPTFRLPELMGTKMRALYQRKKGRDLFDLGLVLEEGRVVPAQVVDCCEHYLALDDQEVTRAQYEENLLGKMEDREFLEDVEPLLASSVDYDPNQACDLVMDELVAELEGDPWKGRSGLGNGGG